MPKRILVVLSGTPYTEIAILRGLDLARTHGASLTGVSILDQRAALRPEPVPIGGASVSSATRVRQLARQKERVEASIHRFESALRENGVPGRVVRGEGDPVDVLCSQWRLHDLTILGIRGLLEYGVVAEPEEVLVRLVTSGVRPILAVSGSYRPIRSVMIAYSGSMESAKTMKRFAQMRLYPGATVRLVHFGDAVSEEELGRAADYLRAWGWSVDAGILRGDVRTELLPQAEHAGADLIVMGDSARSLFTRRLFGDTALRVIRSADRPLFLSH